MAGPMRLAAPGVLNEQTLDGFASSGPTRAGLQVDLLPLRFVAPCGLVALACEIEHHVALGENVDFHRPESVDAANCLSTMNLGTILEEWWGIRDALSPVRRRDLSGRILELRRYENQDGADELTEIVEQRLSHCLLPREAQPVMKAVRALATNAVEHSGTGVGYFAAQVYEPGRLSARVDFAVGDWGQGIRHSLGGTTHTSPSEVSAIERAVRTGVSRYGPDPTRGTGLPFAVFDKAVARGGQITVRSGNGAVSFFPGGGRFRRRISPRPGVLVSGSIPCV